MPLTSIIQKSLFFRLCLSLLIAMPTSVWAGTLIQDEMPFIGIGCLPIVIGAIFGGITSTFIKTEVDVNLNHVWLAKLVIGTGLGFFACVTWQAYSPTMTMLKLAFPSFALGSLGAPIMVFLLTWAADPKTRAKAAVKLNNQLGLPRDFKSDDEVS
jgi:hypothetical protein